MAFSRYVLWTSARMLWVRLVESKLHFWVVNFVMIHPRQGFDGFSSPVHILLIVILGFAPGGQKGSPVQWFCSHWGKNEKHRTTSSAKQGILSVLIAFRGVLITKLAIGGDWIISPQGQGMSRLWVLEYLLQLCNEICTSAPPGGIIFSWACDWEEATLGFLFAWWGPNIEQIHQHILSIDAPAR